MLITLVFSIFIFIVIHFAWGFLLVKRLLPDINLVIKFPIYVGIGLTFSTCVLTSIVIFHPIISTIYYVLPWVLLLVKYYKKITIEGLKDWIKQFQKQDLILSLFLFSTSFFLVFENLINQNAYSIFLPVLGDCEHGSAFTSAILHFNTTFLNYPTGEYVLAASLTTFVDLFPGEALNIITAIVQALLPCLLYSIVYLVTKSPFFSTLIYLLFFWISGLWFYSVSYALNILSFQTIDITSLFPFTGIYNGYWDYMNGSFARVWGIFYTLVFLSLIFSILIRDLAEKVHLNSTIKLHLLTEIKTYLKSKEKIYDSICLGFVISAIVYTYALYIPIIAIFIILNIFYFFLSNYYQLIIKQALSLLFGAIFSCLYILLVITLNSTTSTLPTLNFSNVLLVIILGGLFFLLILIFKKRQIGLERIKRNLIYIVYLNFSFSIMVFFFVIKRPIQVDPIKYWIITPFQLIGFPYHQNTAIFIASYLFSAILFYGLTQLIINYRPYLFNKILLSIDNLKIIPSTLRKYIKNNFQTFLTIGLICIGSPLLIAHFVRNQQPEIPESDLHAMLWLEENAEHSEIIANDPNYWIQTGYILSFSIKNITSWRFCEFATLYPYKEFLKNPYESSATIELFNKYIPDGNYAYSMYLINNNNIKFIYVYGERSSSYVSYWDDFASAQDNISIAFQEANSRIYLRI